MLAKSKKRLLCNIMIEKCCIPCWSSHTITYILLEVLHPMLVKSYNHLHLVGNVASSFAYQDVDQEYGLAIF
jgi:hypothetical protein